MRPAKRLNSYASGRMGTLDTFADPNLKDFFIILITAILFYLVYVAPLGGEEP